MPGKLLAPDRVNQSFGADDLVRVEEQDRQQGALLDAAEGECLALAPNLERSQDPNSIARSPADGNTMRSEELAGI